MDNNFQRQIKTRNKKTSAKSFFLKKKIKLIIKVRTRRALKCS